MLYDLCRNTNKMLKNVIAGTKKYFEKNNKSTAVIGISGGIDSALTAAICKEAGLHVIGRSLPILTNKKAEISRASAIGKAFCDDFKTTSLALPYIFISKFIKIKEKFSIQNSDKFQKSDMQKGNIKARIRMIYLYHLAHLHNGIVVSTDNYSEFLLGFWTLHGDVGDFAPLQYIWKTEIYRMADILIEKYYKDEAIMKAIWLLSCTIANPTDGLGISKSDMEQIGVKSYREVDEVLIEWLERNPAKLEKSPIIQKHIDELMFHPAVQRHISSSFKRNNPASISRINLL